MQMSNLCSKAKKRKEILHLCWGELTDLHSFLCQSPPWSSVLQLSTGMALALPFQ